MELLLVLIIAILLLKPHDVQHMVTLLARLIKLRRTWLQRTEQWLNQTEQKAEQKDIVDK